MDKLLAKKTSDLREVQVVDAMEDICQSKYFKTYDLSPPTTVKVCKFLIGELPKCHWVFCNVQFGKVKR